MAASSCSSADCSSRRLTGSVTTPAPAPYHRRWRTRWRSSSARRPPGVRRPAWPPCPAACSNRSSVRSEATCSSAGGRTGETRPTRARARSDHSKTSAGSPWARASARPCRARLRPWPTRVLCRSRLPKDDCHACRSSSPARTWSRACRPSPLASASSARTSRQSSLRGHRRAGTEAHSVQAGLGVLEVSPHHADPGPLQLDDGGVVLQATASQVGDQGVDPVEQRCGVAAGGDLCDERSSVRQQRAPGAGLPAEAPGRASRDHARAAGVLTQHRPREGQLALGLEGAQASRPVRVRGRSQCLDRLAGSAGSGEDLGTILLDGGAVGG